MKKSEVNDLLIKIQEGDNQAFEYLYEQTSQGVYSFIFSYMRDSMDTDDAIQLTYMKIKNNISQYKEGSNGLAWILQIAKNTALNELRSKRNYQKAQTDLSMSYPKTSTNACQEQSILEIMKNVLSEEEQQIIILHVIWSYRHKDIAKILDIPIGTVTSKYKRAISKVKSAWKEEVK